MKKIQVLLWNENVIAIILSSISFCLYFTTMSRSVGFTDSGELAAVVCTLGIAHPTGYPLFTLLGRFWMMLPVKLEQIVWLNMFSAFLTSSAVGIFFKTTLAIRKSSEVFPVQNINRKEKSDQLFILASAIGSLILGFSTTFWSQSTAIEVYALHLVLVLFTVWSFIGGLEDQLINQNIISSKLLLFAFVLGLSFTNHMTTILLAPGFLWLYFRTLGFSKNAFRKILMLVPFFLLGLSVYLYLPIRSAGKPLLDWGHPATLERFIWHISGKQFRVWMFSGWGVVQKQLAYYFTSLTSEFFILILIFVVIGLIVLFKKSRKLFAFLNILFLSTIIYSVNYDIFDISSYFLLSYIVLGWFFVFGIHFLAQWSKKQKNWQKVLVLITLVALPISQVINNRKNADESNNTIPQQFVERAFSQLEPNAVVLAGEWDYFISPSWYYQIIRNKRPDVTIIDKSLLQNRTWYFLQLERQAPWLMNRVRDQVNLFLGELNKFEHDEPLNLPVIQSCWQNLITSIVEKSLYDRPVYVDIRIDKEFPTQYQRIPAGLFLRLSSADDTICYRTAITPFPQFDLRLTVYKDLQEYYSAMLLFEADWLLKRGKTNEAKIVLREILRVDPGNYSIAAFLQKLQ